MKVLKSKKRCKSVILATIFVFALLYAAVVDADDTYIDFKCGVKWFEWEDLHDTYNGAVIPDAETAIEVADIIRFHMTGLGNVKSWPLQQVFYDIEEHVWIISYWKDEGGESDRTVSTSMCLNIAVRESDGCIVTIWFDE